MNFIRLNEILDATRGGKCITYFIIERNAFEGAGHIAYGNHLEEKFMLTVCIKVIIYYEIFT